MIILGLDMSSICIGYAVLGGTAPAWGHTDLAGRDVAARCAQAADRAAALLDAYAPALVVIESPVARFAKALIPQARVSGAVLAVLAQRRALWTEVSPARAKTVLTGKGTADKAAMVAAAAAQLGLVGDVVTIKGKVTMLDVAPVLTEDEADAYALALAGQRVRVVTKGAA